jgi:hypothetical protein
MRTILSTVAVTCLFAGHAAASGPGSGTGIYDPALEPRVESLLKQMTLEEKVGQLVQYSAGQPTGPGTGRTDYEDMIAKGQIGALFNISRVVDENVDAVPARQRAFDHRVNRSRIANINLASDRLEAVAPQCGNCLTMMLGIAARDHHAGAKASERAGDFQADSGAASRHDGGLSLEHLCGEHGRPVYCGW